MRLLQKGMHGDDVEAWQHFLTGKRFLKNECDGDFGPATESATFALQKQWNLPQDGKLNRQTLSVAVALGFMDMDGGENKEDPSWPPAPTIFGPPGQAFRDANFEKFTFKPTPTPSNPEKIDIEDGWEHRNIITVKIPQLNGVEGYPSSGVSLHKIVAPRVIELFSEWEKQKLLKLILSWNGSYVTRFVRGSRKTISNHATGSAFDINVRWNQLGVSPALVGQEGSVRELVPTANEYGFWWGGHYGRNLNPPNLNARLDGMHFELGMM
jgi:hypothetical protein